MSIVVKTDFKGEYNVAKTCYDQLETFIEKYEKKYLTRLLGAELYTLFKDDLTTGTPQVPQTQRFTNIFDEFSIDDHDCLYCSDGIRKMLVQLIYFHYVVELQTENTAGGTVMNSVELGVNAAYKNNLVIAYNEGITNAKNIQWYIWDNELEYTEENMQKFEYTSGI